MSKYLVVYGTRPEAIKLAPVVKEMRKTDDIEPVLVCTGQHRDLLQGTLALGKVDFDLDVMTDTQTPLSVTHRALEGLQDILLGAYDGVIVQGDAQSAFAGALAGYLTQTPVIHVEAGLRTHDLTAPYPEEGNRVMIDHIATLLCAPTDQAKANLEEENVKGAIRVTGNTEIDALYYALTQMPAKTYPYKKFVLVTAHRRENFDDGLDRICRGLEKLSRWIEHDIVWPVHPNPRVKQKVYSKLEGMMGIHLIDPVDYISFAHLMSKAELILTDSGGIQEDAAALDIPTLVLRDKTERVEGLKAGMARLVGTDPEDIVQEAVSVLKYEAVYESMSKHGNPYGDGGAARRIVEALRRVP